MCVCVCLSFANHIRYSVSITQPPLQIVHPLSNMSLLLVLSAAFLVTVLGCFASLEVRIVAAAPLNCSILSGIVIEDSLQLTYFLNMGCYY